MATTYLGTTPQARPHHTSGTGRLRVVERLMSRITWDLNNPPAEPPETCLDRQRWRLAYQILTEHQLEDAGSHCACGEVWPCFEHKRAERGLVTACLQVGAIKVSGAATSDVCRWCGRGIAQLSLHRWVHQVSGLLVCEVLPDDAPPLCVAEPNQ